MTKSEAPRGRRPRGASAAAVRREEAGGDFPAIVVEKCPCGAPVARPGARWCGSTCRTDRASRPRRARPPAKKRASRFSYSPIGIDGEGEDGRYTLLAAADQAGHELYVQDRSGLDTEACLHFLLSLPAKPFLFGFAFSYDVNMMLVSLTPDHLFTLAQWGHVFWGDWRISHVPGKALTVTHQPTKRSRTIWDLYPWIQSSFVTMLEDFELADEATLSRIRAMKDQRADFTGLDMDQIRAYCLEECQLLSKAVRLLLDLISQSGYTTKVFYSPGSLAAAVMKAHDVNDYRLEGTGGVLATAIDQAYVGARAEVAQVGPIEGPLEEWDINSAYPAAAVELPCFAHGVWTTYRRGSAISDTTLVKVRWTCPKGTLWGPFPVRPRVGSLRFPTSGEAWVWGREARIGREVCDRFEILSGWRWTPSCRHRPFSYLGELYDQRRVLKDEGSPLEYVYKLILNSTYGKLAQRPYGDTDPTWRFLPWAGLITSSVRAILLEQIVAVGPRHVKLVATDCLITDRPLPGVQPSTALGGWSVHRYADLFVAGPGFYEARAEGEAAKVRNRGISRINIEFEELRTAWRDRGREATVELHTRRFIGYRQALQYAETEQLWRQFIDVPMLKSMTLEPRREWRYQDVHDGRSRAPSAEYVDHHELTDMIDSLRLRSVATNVQEDLVRRLIAADDLSRRGLFDAAEQPNWLIDEFQSG